MAGDKSDHLVASHFDSEVQAEQAADSLKDRDKANGAIKLGAISVVSEKRQGQRRGDQAWHA